MLKTTTALVLAGGFGTRLKSVVKDIPKPMAVINDKPFLHYLFLYLAKQGIKKVVLLVGYKHEIIENYFGDYYEGIEVFYSIEHEPLGTGGAVKQALQAHHENCFMLNGDTFFDVDLKAIENEMNMNVVDIAIALSMQYNFDRYGTVLYDAQKKVIAFEEKKFVQQGWINGGVYWINKNLFDRVEILQAAHLPARFSLEKDVFETFAQQLNIKAFLQEKYFIDIGIPEDYARAQIELVKHFAQDGNTL